MYTLKQDFTSRIHRDHNTFVWCLFPLCSKSYKCYIKHFSWSDVFYDYSTFLCNKMEDYHWTNLLLMLLQCYICLLFTIVSLITDTDMFSKGDCYNYWIMCFFVVVGICCWISDHILLMPSGPRGVVQVRNPILLLPRAGPHLLVRVESG